MGLFRDGASPCGALDMSGNVWEWTRSLWGNKLQRPSFVYPYRPGDVNREDLRAADDVLRVLRGGSFNSTEFFLRATYRDGGTPDFRRYGLIGFRVASSRLHP